MPRTRKKNYKAGDIFTVYIPPNIDERTLKFINSQKHISPTTIEILKDKAKEVYPNYYKDKEINKKENK